MKKLATASMALLLGLAFSGCGKHSDNYFIYMPDMYWTKGLKYQQPGMKPPVPGTVARGQHAIPATMTMEEAGKTYQNPLRRTEAVLERGRHVYMNTCVVCHGPTGEGDGYIVPKFPRPPSLLSDKIRGYPDGNIYYIISHGQNLMSSYASQIRPEDRWAVVHYIRAMERSKKPTAEDLKTVSN
ncbi:MAG: cytochrome c [Bdellovibrionales bacterium]|nr:cytochrome c [Bdellovibrionales bacterium]